MIFRTTFIILFLLISQHTIFAQQNFELSIRSDNDMYLLNLQDQYYTNGLFISFRKRINPSSLRTNELNKNWGLTAGQKIYNAHTAQSDSLKAVDRPIAGYLFLSAFHDRYYTNDSHLSLRLEIGGTGNWTGGKKLQEGLHDLLNMYHASGWEYQINSTFGANASILYNHVLLRANSVFDLSVQTQATVGLNDIRAQAGPTIRLGKINAFHESAHFSGRLQSKNKRPKNEWYLYYTPDVNLVFYDVSVQGGMFRSDKGAFVDIPNRWLLSNQFGAVVAGRKTSFKLNYFFNTKETKRAIYRHQYGSFSISQRF